MLQAKLNENRPADIAKESEFDRKSLNFGFRMLRIAGLHLDQPIYSVKGRFIVSFAFHICVVLAAGIKFITESDKFHAMDYLSEPIIGGAIVIVKIVSLFYYKDEWQTLFAHYRNTGELGNKSFKGIQFILKYMDKLLKFYTLGFWTLGLGMAFRGNLPLPPSIFINFEKSPQHEVALIITTYIYLFMCYVFVAWDVIFYSIITYVYCEFDVVKHEFETLNGNESSVQDKFAAVVQHHKSVLSCIPCIQTVSSLVLLLQFFSQSVGICMALLTFQSLGSNMEIDTVIEKGGLLVVVGCHVFYTCFAGAQLTEQSESVGMAIFHSPFWLDAPLEVKKQVVLVIRRSQEHEGFTMCGLGNIDMELFKIVLKLSVTFFNVLVAMDMKKRSRQGALHDE